MPVMTAEATKTFYDFLKPFLGEKIVFIAARYQYWGILSEIGTDAVVLANAVAVQRSGSAQGEEPEITDPIGGSIIIKTDAIELLFRPKWCHNALPNEDASSEATSN